MYAHALIVGGTGMLRGASIALALRSRHLTSVARTRRSLQALDEALTGMPCAHSTHALDWSEPRAFVAAVAARALAVGPPDLVLAWLHDDCIGPALARALASVRGHCEFFQVRASAAADPSLRGESWWRAQDEPAGIAYHQIILGFHVEAGRSRWLRDAEICTGVLAAIDAGRDVSFVGSVAPWSLHP